VLYYKDVLDILTHPLVEPYAKANTLVKSSIRIIILLSRIIDGIECNSAIISSIIPKWEKGSIPVLETISKLLQTIKENLSNDNEEENHEGFCICHFQSHQ
jgi:hypothetical protein